MYKSTSPDLAAKKIMNGTARLEFRRFELADYSQWKQLAAAYKTFYQTCATDKEFEVAFDRIVAGEEVDGLGVFDGTSLVAISHHFFHTTVWEPSVCYLQDLFVTNDYRGQGIAAELIRRIARTSHEAGANKFYWMTHSENEPARKLYERVANFSGFIRYDYSTK